MVSDGACPPLDFTFRIDGQAGGKTGGGEGGGSVKRTDGCGNGRSGFGIDRTDFRSGQLPLIKADVIHFALEVGRPLIGASSEPLLSACDVVRRTLVRTRLPDEGAVFVHLHPRPIGSTPVDGGGEMKPLSVLGGIVLMMLFASSRGVVQPPRVHSGGRADGSDHDVFVVVSDGHVENTQIIHGLIDVQPRGETHGTSDRPVASHVDVGSRIEAGPNAARVIEFQGVAQNAGHPIAVRSVLDGSVSPVSRRIGGGGSGTLVKLVPKLEVIGSGRGRLVVEVAVLHANHSGVDQDRGGIFRYGARKGSRAHQDRSLA